MKSLDRLHISRFKFGVELEVGIDIDQADEYLDLEPDWWLQEEHCGSEIVSPKLIGYKGLLSVRRQLDNIKWLAKELRLKTIPIKDCGLHVHIDAQDYTMGNAKRLLKLARRFNVVLFTMLPGSRWNNQYARQLTFSEKRIDKCRTLADIQNLSDYGRYMGLNFYAFPKHGTIEFRYAQGTADWGKVYSLISLYLRMTAFAKSDKPVPDYKAIESHSAGPNLAAERMKNHKTGFQILLDTLGISGEVRKILSEMFEDNKNKRTRGSDRVTEDIRSFVGLKVRG